jgi:predicted YcjX-like family ATPase
MLTVSGARLDVMAAAAVRIARDDVSSESGRSYWLIGGTNVEGGGSVPLLPGQHGGGAKLDEFEEHDFRHPHPDSGISPANAIRARRNRLFNMVGSHRVV